MNICIHLLAFFLSYVEKIFFWFFNLICIKIKLVFQKKIKLYYYFAIIKFNFKLIFLHNLVNRLMNTNRLSNHLIPLNIFLWRPYSEELLSKNFLVFIIIYLFFINVTTLVTNQIIFGRYSSWKTLVTYLT